MADISKYFFKFRGLVSLINSTKRITLPGFDNVPLFDVAVFFFRGLWNGAITFRASSLAFNFFVALFPFLIFLFTLIPYIPVTGFQDNLLIMLQDFLPRNAFLATKDTLEDILKHERGGLLSIGFIAALYFSTNGIHAMMDGFNETYHTVETRTFFKQRLVSLLLTIILSLLLFFAIGLLILSEVALNYIESLVALQNYFAYFLLYAGRWIIVLGLIFTGISFLYYFGPAKQKRFRFVSAGSTLASFLTIVLSLGFAFFINNFGNYNKLYGSIGTLLVIMLWMYFNSIILLIGFELNASIENAKRSKQFTETGEFHII